MYRLAALVVTLVLMAASAIQAAPYPEPAPTSTAWNLEFRFQPPTPIRLEVPGQGRQTYWYVLYTVVNPSDQDLLFTPEFTLYTDTGRIIRTARGLSPQVFQAIKSRHNNPLLENPTQIRGLIRQGEDSAREGVAIFPDIDPEARQFDLFVGGLSGQTEMIRLPVPVMVDRPNWRGEVEQVRTDRIRLQKTLRLRYRLPGESGARLWQPPRLVEQEWVMR